MTRQQAIVFRLACVATCGFLLLGAAGCGPRFDRFAYWASGGWAPTFETAEQRAAETDSETLFYYRHRRNHDPIVTAIDETSRRGLVCCALSSDYEPNRRYAAQFGVERAPALILVHADGTFHTLTGLLTRERVASFLSESRPPGAVPKHNPLIVRHVPLDGARPGDDAR